MSTINDSPVSAPIQPLHNPSQAAHIVVPTAPLGNMANQAPGMGAKALLAKKFAKNHNPNFISPTDNLMTPCTQKLTAAKKKHFTKGPQPMGQLLQAQRDDHSDETSSGEETPAQTADIKMNMDDENPF